MFEKIEDKEKYFIQPFIDGEKVLIKINFENNIIHVKQFNKNNKETYILKKIKDELTGCYKFSKFSGYNIILKGFIVRNYKKVKSLLLYDIMTADEYEGRVQSKKYEVRLENLNIRFLLSKMKRIKSIFSYKFTDTNLRILFNQFIKQNTLDGYVFHKNIPYKYDDNEVIIENNICTYYSLDIEDVIIGTTIKQKIDEKNNKIESTEAVPCLLGIKVKIDNELVEINFDNILDSEKIKYFNEINDIKQMKCVIKKYDFLDICCFIFVKFE